MLVYVYLSSCFSCLVLYCNNCLLENWLLTSTSRPLRQIKLFPHHHRHSHPRHNNANADADADDVCASSFLNGYKYNNAERTMQVYTVALFTYSLANAYKIATTCNYNNQSSWKFKHKQHNPVQSSQASQPATYLQIMETENIASRSIEYSVLQCIV